MPLISKGFKPAPRLKKGEAARLDRICDAVLNDEPGAIEQFAAWVIRTSKKQMGGKIEWAEWLVTHSQDELSPDLYTKLHESFCKMMPKIFPPSSP